MRLDVTDASDSMLKHTENRFSYTPWEPKGFFNLKSS